MTITADDPLAAAHAQARRRAARKIRQLCEIVEPLTVSEWADKYRELPETSTAPGKYESRATPYLCRPQDLMGDPAVPMVVCCFASQTGKSTAIENAIGHRIDRAPSPIIVVRPKIDDAESWAKERFVPMVKATRRLRERVRLGRSSDATMRYKGFDGGFLFVASAQSATELASRSAPTVILDEVDRMETIAGEGNPVEIALRRQGAADVATAILTSTPRDEETTIIWPYLEAGTYEKYYVPCPHCRHMQELVRAQLDHATCCYVCIGCGVLIEERYKPWMLDPANGAAWIATNPEGRYPSFHLNALYSPFAKSGWREFVDAWTRAQGKPQDLQVVVNTWLAELWKETSELLDIDALTARLEPGFTRGTVPVGVGALTLGVDVQHDRVEWWVWGWGEGLESWVVDHGVIAGDPELEAWNVASVWAQLEREVLDRDFPLANGGTMRINAGFVDSAYATQKVYRAVKRWRGRRVFPSRGEGERGIPILKGATRRKDDGVLLHHLGVDQAKTEFLRSQLYTKAPGPGFVHLPDWIDTAALEQLIAEKRSRRLHRGQVIYEWVKKTGETRNEGLDCRVYARAALEQLGAKFQKTLGARAAKLAGTPIPLPAAPAAPVEPPPPKDYTEEARRSSQRRPKPPGGGRGWVNGWRR